MEHEVHTITSNVQIARFLYAKKGAVMKHIYKAAGIIIRQNRVLATRSHDQDVFINPGGKLIKDETYEEALIRELHEELGISVTETDVQPLGEWDAVAAYDADSIVHIKAFLVTHFEGDIMPSNEVEELLWLDYRKSRDYRLGSILEEEIIPLLKRRKLLK
jgi:8-oxo-dGTP diphosphatase